MPPGAHSDPAAVRELAVALRRYAIAAQSVTDQVHHSQIAFSRQVAGEVGRRRSARDRALAALDSCLRDPEADCSRLQQMVSEAEQGFSQAQKAMRIFEQAEGRYALARSRFDRGINTINSESQQALSTIERDLDQYLISQSSQGGGGGGGGAVGCGNAQMISSSATTLAVPAGFPSGTAMVPLASIDDSESTVTGPESFGKGYAPADLMWGFDTLLSQILPAMALGKGLDYFRDRDQRENLCGTRSYADTYQGFFGADDVPRFTRQPDGSFRVENGYHRVWVARQMGLTTIPGQVIGS